MLGKNEEFLFGAASSSHQVEGNTRNDWAQWESVHAEKLYEANGGVYELENYISGIATNHYVRYEGDFDYAKILGHTAHRLSIEWSRIEPKQGQFQDHELRHYQMVIDALRKRNIEPFVTINHWTLPLWFRDKGGWLHSASVKHFEEYVKVLAHSLPDVTFWITLNEPMIMVSHGYWRGNWPPGIKSLRKSISALQNLVYAHKAAYVILKKFIPQAQVGIAKNNIYFSRTWKILHRYCWNHWFLKRIRRQLDFIGVNYYFSDRHMLPVNDMGWATDPDGLEHVITELDKYKLPVYITENGVADGEDILRAKYILEHLRAIKRARSRGSDVRGYFYWSLTDNFEWDKGFWPRFGLVRIDYTTLQRFVRDSAWEYKKYIQIGIDGL